MVTTIKTQMGRRLAAAFSVAAGVLALMPTLLFGLDQVNLVVATGGTLIAVGAVWYGVLLWMNQ